jgi:glutaconate CoA-transferase subunit B
MNYSETELLCIMASRILRDELSVFAGVGLPLLAVALAKRSHAPRLTMIVEGGVIGSEVVPGRLPISTNEMRLAHKAMMLPGITDTLLFAQRGFIDMGFMGAAQIDRYGNVNTSLIGTPDRPRVRLPGSGGANDMISLCRETVIVTMHEKRRFVPRVDFVTSPGYLNGGDSRLQAGLIFGRVSQVITNLGIFDFEEETKVMRLKALHPGVTVEAVLENTGFDLVVPEQVPVSDPPTQQELELLRSLDPERRFL